MKYGKIIASTMVTDDQGSFDQAVNEQIRDIEDEGSVLRSLTFETLAGPDHGLTFIAHFVIEDGEYAG